MSLAEDLSGVYAKLQTVLDDANAEIVGKGGSAAKNMHDLSGKIKSIERYDNLLGFINGSIQGEFVVPYKVTTIRPYCFSALSISSVIIHDNVFVINNYAFNQYMPYFESVTFEGTTTIYSNSFNMIGNALKTVNIPKGWNNNLYFHNTNALTKECLHSMIENLKDRSMETTQYVFQVGATNLAKIDEDHITLLEYKNWDYK